MVALVDVFIGPSPGMVHSHGIIGSNGTIQKGELLLALVITVEVSL